MKAGVDAVVARGMTAGVGVERDRKAGMGEAMDTKAGVGVVREAAEAREGREGRAGSTRGALGSRAWGLRGPGAGVAWWNKPLCFFIRCMAGAPLVQGLPGVCPAAGACEIAALRDVMQHAS